MKLGKKFAIAATAAIGIGTAFGANAASHYVVWGALGSYAAQESGATDSFEGPKRILRWDTAPYDSNPGHTELFIFDTAKNELCREKHKLNDPKGKALSSDCDPTTSYDELHMETIKMYTCSAAKKDPVNAKEVLAFCAGTDSYGKKLPQPVAP